MEVFRVQSDNIVSFCAQGSILTTLHHGHESKAIEHECPRCRLRIGNPKPSSIRPMATGAVPDVVKEAVETKAKDDICNDVLCIDVNEDWAVSTSSRDFYAWSILNVDDVENNGTEPIYEKIGPVKYDVTLKRTVENYDLKNGLLTYSQITSYACSDETWVPCDTNVSQLNIAFNPQVIGATGTAMNQIMEITKSGFASGVIDIYFQQVSAAYGVADEIKDEHMAILSTVEGYPGKYT